MNRRDFLKNAGLAAGSAFAMESMSFGAPLISENTCDFQTKHVIWIINGNGSRKTDWYENPSLSPNYTRLAAKAFVYANSHNDTVSNHGRAWAEVITGNPHRNSTLTCPTPLQYVRKAYGDSASNYWFMNGVSHFRQWRYHSQYLVGQNTRPVSLTAAHVFVPRMKRTPAEIVAAEFPDMDLTAAEKKKLEDFVDAATKAKLWEFNLKNAPIPRDPFIGDALGLELVPHVMRAFKPRMLIYHQVGHDSAHGNGGYWRSQTGYLDYERVCRTTDEQIGKIFDFVKNDPYFSKNTAIVVRPEFGRDDEIDMYGELNHTDGYYQTHRSAEIWYGPDFKAGSSERLTNRRDVVPSLTRLFNVDADCALGQVHREMFNDSLGVSRGHFKLPAASI